MNNSIRRNCWRFIILLLLIFLYPIYAYAAPADNRISYLDTILSIGGMNCGNVKGVSGGKISAEVRDEKLGSGNYSTKQLGAVKYNDLKVPIGFNLPKSVFSWISDFCKYSNNQKDCQLSYQDFSKAIKTQMLFSNCLISSITIPECNGQSEDEGSLTLILTPESINEIIPAKPISANFEKNQKNWQSSDFIFEIDGKECKEVIRIEPFTIKASVIEDNVGLEQIIQNKPSKLIFPNLKITISDSGSKYWKDWANDFIIKGNNKSGNAKIGHLYFLPRNSKSNTLDRNNALGLVTFHNLGICSFGITSDETGSRKDLSYQVELYCESMDFSANGTVNTTSTNDNNSTQQTSNTTSEQTTDAIPATGECKIGQKYSIGTKNPLNIVVNSLEYTVGRVKVANRYMRPAREEKLLLLHYSLQNPSNVDVRVGQGSIDWMAIDSNNVSRLKNSVCVENTGDSLNQNILPPGKTIDCYTFFRMPSKGIASILTMAPYAEKSDAYYDIREAVAKIPEPYVDSSDSSGSTPLMSVPGKIGTAYMVGDYDLTVNSVNKSTMAIAGRSELPSDLVYVLVAVDIKGYTEDAYHFSGDNIVIKDNNGQTFSRLGTISMNSNEFIDIKPVPGEILKCRMVYRVPKKAIIKTVTMIEDTRRSINVEL